MNDLLSVAASTASRLGRQERPVRGAQAASSQYGCRSAVASEWLPRTRGRRPLSRRAAPHPPAGDAPELRGREGRRSESTPPRHRGDVEPGRGEPQVTRVAVGAGSRKRADAGSVARSGLARCSYRPPAVRKTCEHLRCGAGQPASREDWADRLLITACRGGWASATGPRNSRSGTAVELAAVTRKSSASRCCSRS